MLSMKRLKRQVTSTGLEAWRCLRDLLRSLSTPGASPNQASLIRLWHRLNALGVDAETFAARIGVVLEAPGSNVEREQNRKVRTRAASA
jgi:hypothetical protein